MVTGRYKLQRGKGKQNWQGSTSFSPPEQM